MLDKRLEKKKDGRHAIQKERTPNNLPNPTPNSLPPPPNPSTPPPRPKRCSLTKIQENKFLIQDAVKHSYISTFPTQSAVKHSYVNQFRAQDAAQHIYHYLTNFALIIWSVNRLMRTLVLLYTVEQITCEDYLRFSNGYPWRNTLKDEQKCVEKQRKACN